MRFHMKIVLNRICKRISLLKMNKSLLTSNNAKIPRLLLFDLDGTLTTSHYKDRVRSHPLAKALSEAFGKDIRRNSVQFAGGTDRSIIRDLLAANEITEKNTPDYESRVAETLRVLPGFMRRGIEEGLNWWTSLPNVPELLLRLSKLPDVQLALLTGNIAEDARIKLESASVDVSLFEVMTKEGQKQLLGAFGDDHEIRRYLVPAAQKRYSEYIGKPVSSEDMIIIGDTPKDIACAHDNGIPCVAVATGPYTSDKLTGAEYVLKDGFVDLDESIKVILETRKK